MKTRQIGWSDASGQRQAGFTLIELMIALTLGLLIVAAATFTFVSSRQSYRTQEGLAEVQEGSRNSVRIITTVVRNAGYVPDPISQPDPTSLFVAPRTAINGSDNAPPPAGFIASPSSVQPGTDSLVATYYGNDDGATRTCLGDAVPAAQHAVNIFYLKPAVDGLSTLNCYTEIGTTQRNEPLLGGVTDFQVLYGIDTDGDKAANRYVTAAAVSDWTLVSSVQLTLALASTEKSAAGADNAYRKAGRINRSLTTTIAMRNSFLP